MAVFSSGHPPGTSPVRRSRKFRTICFKRSTVFGISCVPSKRVSIAIFQAWLKASRKHLLACKVPVDPAFFEPCRSHEVGEGGAVIPSLIKDGRRLADDFLPGLLAFAHLAPPKPALRPTGR